MSQDPPLFPFEPFCGWRVISLKSLSFTPPESPASPRRGFRFWGGMADRPGCYKSLEGFSWGAHEGRYRHRRLDRRCCRSSRRDPAKLPEARVPCPREEVRHLRLLARDDVRGDQ